MLYMVQPFDLATFCAASGGIIALLACAVWWPARRAAHIDPHEALRYE
jgi:ABC-type lipoprotein release transport system permease subunit